MPKFRIRHADNAYVKFYFPDVAGLFYNECSLALINIVILESSLIGAFRVKLFPRIRDRSHGSLASLRGQRWAAA
jgi:hypothetical protein